jgi:fructose 1,6-bisphosphate aldolase/phosphatase
MAHIVAGGMRGSDKMPLLPVPFSMGTSYFDALPLASCAGFRVAQRQTDRAGGHLCVSLLDTVRGMASGKSMEMRRQGFFGAVMVPMAGLQNTGIVEKLTELDGRFRVRESKRAMAAV